MKRSEDFQEVGRMCLEEVEQYRQDRLSWSEAVDLLGASMISKKRGIVHVQRGQVNVSIKLGQSREFKIKNRPRLGRSEGHGRL